MNAHRSEAPGPALSRVVLGVTGGIAAYKAAELVRLLVKDGVTVDVVLTAARFIADALGRPLSTKVGQAGGWDERTGRPTSRVAS